MDSTVFNNLPISPSDLAKHGAAAFAELRAATAEVQDRQVIALGARRSLQTSRDQFISKHADDPKALGVNEAARESKLRDLTFEDICNCDVADDGVRTATNRRDLAQIDVDHLRQQVRIVLALAMASTAVVDLDQEGL